MEKLLTVREVAGILGISESTAKTWASRRIFPVVKVGRLIRISPKALQEWIERKAEIDPRMGITLPAISRERQISQGRRASLKILDK